MTDEETKAYKAAIKARSSIIPKLTHAEDQVDELQSRLNFCNNIIHDYELRSRLGYYS